MSKKCVSDTGRSRVSFKLVDNGHKVTFLWYHWHEHNVMHPHLNPILAFEFFHPVSISTYSKKRSELAEGRFSTRPHSRLSASEVAWSLFHSFYPTVAQIIIKRLYNTFGSNIDYSVDVTLPPLSYISVSRHLML